MSGAAQRSVFALTWIRLAWFGLACLGLTGCGAEEDAPPPAADAALLLGTGTWRFEPVADGDTLPLIRGAQGGWHVWVALEATGFDPAQGELTLIAEDLDRGEEVAHLRIDTAFDPPLKGGERLLLGWPQVLESPGCVVDHHVLLSATWRGQGVALSDERDVVVGAGDDPPDACE